MIRYQDKYLTIIGDDHIAHSIHTGDAVIAVPLTDDHQVICIIEPSAAFEREIVLLPGGRFEADDDDYAVAVNRELQEEIGFKAGRLDLLGEFHPWAKYMYMRRVNLTVTKRTTSSQNTSRLMISSH